MTADREEISLRGGFLRVSGTRVQYLGYPLDLTRGERSILARLMRAYPDPLTAADFDDRPFRLSSDPAGLLAKHISHINSKALALGGRKIIEHRKNIGYKIAFSL